MIFFRIMQAVFTLVVILILTGCGTSPANKWDDLQTQLDYGNFKTASDEIEKIISKDTLSAEAFYGKALLDEHKGYLWDAHIGYFRAFRVDTTFIPAMKKFILLSADIDVNYLAEQIASRLISIAPDDPDGYLSLAFMNMEADRFDSARVFIDRADAKGADPNEIELFRLELEFRSYDSSRVAAALDELNKIKPENDRQRLHQARLYKELNLDNYRDVLPADDKNLWLRIKRAEYLLEDYFSLDAIEAARDIIAHDSTFGMAYLVAASAYGTLGNEISGRQMTANFIGLKPTSVYGFQKQAEFSADFVDTYNGIEEMDRAFTLAINQQYPKDYLFPIYLKLIHLSIKGNDLPMAMQHLEKGPGLETEGKISQIMRAALMLHFDVVRDSAKILVDQKIEDNLGNRRWLEKAAWYFFYSKRPDSSEILYHRLLDMPQPRVDYYISLLDIFKYAKRIKAADSLYQSLPWQLKNSRLLLDKFYNFYTELKQNDRQYEFANKLYNKSPGFLQYMLNLSELEKGRGNDDAAWELVEKYCDKYPNDLFGWYKFGLLALELGKPDRALACSQHCLDIDSLYGAALELKGVYFRATNQIDSALFYFRRTINLNWPTPLAYYYLGEYLLEKGDSLNRVTGLGMAAVKFFDKDRRGYYLLGRAYMELGKYKLAMSNFRSGVKIFPEDAELNYLLGSAQFYLNDKDKARQYLQKSLKLKDHKLTSAQQEDAEKLLSQI